jgi:hypothetical protein
MSEAVNELVRAGLAQHREHPVPFRQKTHDLGQGMDFSNIGNASETLDGPHSR